MADNLVERQAWRRLVGASDDELLSACDVQAYKASGPGGQHRNKVTSAIRLVHRGSKITVTAGEARSQHENKRRAVRRMREALALQVRTPLAEPVAWPANVQIAGRRLKVAGKNPSLPVVLGLALDALEDCEGRLADAAALLGVSTSSLGKFLREHGKAWSAANEIRGRYGQGPLKG